MAVIRSSGGKPAPVSQPVELLIGARRHHRAVGRWLWGAVALAIGLFVAEGGALAWCGAGLVAATGLVGLIARQRWANTVLWVGLGLCVGLALALGLALLSPEGGGLIPTLPHA